MRNIALFTVLIGISGCASKPWPKDVTSVAGIKYPSVGDWERPLNMPSDRSVVLVLDSDDLDGRIFASVEESPRWALETIVSREITGVRQAGMDVWDSSCEAKLEITCRFRWRDKKTNRAGEALYRQRPESSPLILFVRGAWSPANDAKASKQFEAIAKNLNLY